MTKTNADKVQLFSESVERRFGIDCKHFDSNHFNEVNKFIEANHRYFYPPEDPDDYRFDVGNEDVEDVDAQTLINPSFTKGGGGGGGDRADSQRFFFELLKKNKLETPNFA